MPGHAIFALAALIDGRVAHPDTGRHKCHRPGGNHRMLCVAERAVIAMCGRLLCGRPSGWKRLVKIAMVPALFWCQTAIDCAGTSESTV